MHTEHTACTPSAYDPDGADEKFRDWHHGYAAGDILRAVALACEEAADSRAYLPDFPEFVAATQWLHATSQLVEWRARRMSPTNYGLVSDICRWLFELGREICGTPVGGSNRLDYLLYGIAYKQCDWIEPLKRRKSWLGPRDGDYGDPARGFAGGYLAT